VVRKAVRRCLGAYTLGNEPADFKDPFVPRLADPYRVPRHQGL
jgi:hypothetical protein